MTDTSRNDFSLDYFYRNYKAETTSRGKTLSEDQLERGRIRRSTETAIEEAALQRAVFDPLYRAD